MTPAGNVWGAFCDFRLAMNAYRDGHMIPFVYNMQIPWRPPKDGDGGCRSGVGGIMEQLVAVALLVLIFAISMWREISMGAIAFAVAYLAGTFYWGLTAKDIAAGFPGGMFITLLGVTYLFGIARANGTIRQIVRTVVNAVHGKVVWIPWVFFLLAAAITASGALSIATYSILIPVGLSFARSHRISPLLMGLSILNGTNAGGFSPIAVYFTIVSGVLNDAGVTIQPIPVFIWTFIVNVLLNTVVFFLLDGRALLTGRLQPAEGRTPPTLVIETEQEPATPWTWQQHLTVALFSIMVAAAVFFNLDVGFMALVLAVILAMIQPDEAKKGLLEIGWGVILLIGGMVTFINMLDNEKTGVIDQLAQSVAGVGTPVIAALLMLIVAAIVSAFASTNAMFVVLVPLAAPLLVGGEITQLGFAIALCISASVVDSSPFSTAGALIIANTEEHQTDRTFKGLVIWAFSMIPVAPLLSWLAFIVFFS